MKYRLLLLLTIIVFFSCNKEKKTEAEPEWKHIVITASGSLLPVSIIDVPDGYWLIANEETGSTSRILLVKTDLEGNELQRKIFGGNGSARAFGIRRGISGDFYISCQEGLSGNYDILLLKTDVSGNSITAYREDRGTEERADDIYITDTARYITGRSNVNSGSIFPDKFLMKMRNDGWVDWIKTIGGAETDAGLRIIKTRDNHLLLLGMSYSLGAGDRSFYVSKWTFDGDTLWTKTFGTPAYDEPQDVLELNDGSLLFLGHTAGFGNPEHNLYIFKTDADGNMLREQNFGGSGHDGGQKFFRISDNEIYVIGYSSSFGNTSNAYLLKFNGNLDLLSEEIIEYDGEVESYGLIVKSDQDMAVLSMLIKTDEPAAMLLSVYR